MGWPSLNNCRYGIRVDQTFLNLTKFIKNITIFFISKQIYYKNRFNDLSNDTNYILQILIFSGIYLVKAKKSLTSQTVI